MLIFLKIFVFLLLKNVFNNTLFSQDKHTREIQRKLKEVKKKIQVILLPNLINNSDQSTIVI